MKYALFLLLSPLAFSIQAADIPCTLLGAGGDFVIKNVPDGQATSVMKNITFIKEDDSSDKWACIPVLTLSAPTGSPPNQGK